MKQRAGNRSLSAASDLGMTRRDFARLVTALGALGYIDERRVAMALETDERRLGWLSNRDAGREGTWDVTEIEGTIPAGLDGTLYRTSPGQTSNHGTPLQHLFDGDAFVHAYSIRDGKVRVRAQFVNTPQRAEENEQGRMIYSEYGTVPPAAPADAPKPKYEGKNQPSVNIIPWDGRLLGLSEGGHPTEIDPKTLEFRSYWDYYGTLPANLSHTAHPKFDPVTGVGYCYGLVKGPGLALNVYRMEKSGKLELLHSLPQPGFFMIHDMMISDEHIIFAIPPLKYTLGEMLSGKATPAMALKYFESEPLRYIVMSRDGSGEAITIEQPANTVYHNGNAFMRDGQLVVDSCLSPDHSINDMLAKWKAGQDVQYTQTSATRLVLDLDKRAVVERNLFGQGQDFPRYDLRQQGKDMPYLYTMENGVPDDPISFNKIVRHDFRKGSVETAEAKPGKAMGESVYVPNPSSQREEEGWLLTLVYDGGRNETALEIRDAGSLEFVARAWIGTHVPLGFHGNFVRDWHIA